MNLSSLVKIKSKSKRRVGRGHGSGRVKTSGRGTKGQNAREKVNLRFAGSSLQASWLKRLPLLRGKGKNKSWQIKPVAITLSDLNVFLKSEIVDLVSLKQKELVNSNAKRAKILAKGQLKVALEVAVPVSQQARLAIEKAGGKVVS